MEKVISMGNLELEGGLSLKLAVKDYIEIDTGDKQIRIIVSSKDKGRVTLLVQATKDVKIRRFHKVREIPSNAH